MPSKFDTRSTRRQRMAAKRSGPGRTRMMSADLPFTDGKFGRLYHKPDGGSTTDRGAALEAHLADNALPGSRGRRGGPASGRTHSGAGAYSHGDSNMPLMSDYTDQIANEVASQGIQTRESLSALKTPIGLIATVHPGAGAINTVTQVQQTIPAGSTLWITGLAAGDTLDSVTIDGQGLFVMNPLDSAFVNPANQNAIGFFIEREITQTIAVQTTVAAATTARPVLYVRSIEFLQRTGALLNCLQG